MIIEEQLNKLNLQFLKENIEAFTSRIKKNHTSAITWWLDQEIEALRLRSEQRRLSNSKLGSSIGVNEFQWDALEGPKDLQLQIANLIKKDFVSLHRNVVLIGAEGVGKTALAKILGYQSVLLGHSCLFATASSMISDLNLAVQPQNRVRTLQKYVRPSLLILDEIGYVSCNENSADNLFQVISKRYEEKRSVIVTTNLAFCDWPQALGGAHCVTPIVDRLIENSSVINLLGPSFRLVMHENDNFLKNTTESDTKEKN